MWDTLGSVDWFLLILMTLNHAIQVGKYKRAQMEWDESDTVPAIDILERKRVPHLYTYPAVAVPFALCLCVETAHDGVPFLEVKPHPCSQHIACSTFSHVHAPASV